MTLLKHLKLRVAVILGALLLTTAAAATAGAAGVGASPFFPLFHVSPGPKAVFDWHPDAPRGPKDEQLAIGLEGLSNKNTWTKTRTIPNTWKPAGVDWEQEGLKFYKGRFYISVYDHTNANGHLVILESDGTLVKDIPFVDGLRQHSGGFDVQGDYAYMALAVAAPDSNADILRINIKTYEIKTLFTVGYDHVGGVNYNPVTNHLIGQSWDSRTFYEWTMGGKLVDTWSNPSQYGGYQDCQYVVHDKLLCSAAGYAGGPGGFDLIDLGDPEHAILNGVVRSPNGNANAIYAEKVTDGTLLTQYAAGNGPIDVYTTFVGDPGYVAPALPTVSSSPQGTPAIDGVEDAGLWSTAPALSLTKAGDAYGFAATVRVLHDDGHLYFLADVTDPSRNAARDSVDLWINWTDVTNASYYHTDGAIATGTSVSRDGSVTSTDPAPYGAGDADGVVTGVVEKAGNAGYVLEAAIPWPDGVDPQPKIGFNVSVNDWLTGATSRRTYITWTDTLGAPYKSLSYWSNPNGLPGIDLV